MMGKESTCSRLSRSVALCISPKPTAEIANVPRMRRGKVGGNCLSLPQRERNCIGNNLLLLFPLLLLQESLSTRVSNFICGGGDRVSACGSRKFSMAKSSIIAVSSSISCSLSLWCQCGDEPKECSTLCGAPISSIKSNGGWHGTRIPPNEGRRMAGNTCE